MEEHSRLKMMNVSTVLLLQSADHLIDASFINRAKEMISDRVHKRSHYTDLKPTSDRMGTTHVSVLDEDGLAVSATSTINEL